MRHTDSQSNYETYGSHSHCFDKENPPCGQKIEHYKCCLCGKLNPKIATAVEQRDADVIEMVEKRLTEFIENIPEAYGWGDEDKEADRGYQICSKNVKAMLLKEKNTILTSIRGDKK